MESLGLERWPEEQMRSIGRMLNPKSIAIVGASEKGGYGGRLMNAVAKAKDKVQVFPVNPNHKKIAGFKSYASVLDLPLAPDLVCIVVPHEHVLPVLEQCHEKKAGSAVIISAGFAERGTASGLEQQHKLGAFAKNSGMRVAGPNCLGLANVRDNIWATASSRTLGGLTGHIALVCQSGATAFGPFLTRAVDAGIGLSHIISTGNEADLDFSDFARYLLDDDSTRVIAGFVEGFRDVRKFVALAELAAQRGKPIVLIKIGRSESGAQAARSHTAALTGSDAFYEAVFKQYGVIRVQDYDELLEVAHLHASSHKPEKPGIAVVSHSGGISSLTADMLGVAGLSLPALTERARTGINGILKDFGSAANPADVTGFARSEEFPKIMDFLVDEPDVGTLVIASAGAGKQIDQVIELRNRTKKNIAFFWTGSRGDDSTLPKLKSSNIPIFYSPQRLAHGLKSLVDYHAWRERRLAAGSGTTPALTPQQEQTLERLRGLGHSSLSEKESKQLIAEWGVPVTRELPAPSSGVAVDAAQLLGYPVALKLDSPDILHKTEAGVVRLRLRSADEVRSAYDVIMANAVAHAPNATISGVLVQEMVPGGVEVIVGVKYDDQLGPMLLFGSGGVMVEVYNDVTLRHCPITRAEALEMISEVKGSKLLRGFRGKAAADVDALADTLVRVSHMASHLEGQLSEVDINPLMVLPKGQGVKAVDGLVVLRTQTATLP
jgi:acyl-CoA synthetase (NDP forming)